MLRKLILISLSAAALTAAAQQADNYKPANPGVKLTETNLPILFINTHNQMIPKEEKILAQMKIIDNINGVNYGDTIAHPDQRADYDGWISLKHRGNSSFSASDKKPYTIRTLAGADLDGKKEKVSLLGMGKDNRWATIAPWCDRSMMRDILTFELARPHMHYVPNGRHVEMIVDGTYYGIVLLMERVSGGKYRLNLDDPSADDLTGDFHVELDRDNEPNYTSPHHPWQNASGTLRTDKYIHYKYATPEEEDFADLPEGTREAIHKAIDDMERSFLADNYTDPENGYRKYIDPNSFIDYMLATELSMNVDGYRLSTNMFKYSDSHAAKTGYDNRWQMSLWDFNIAYGNANYADGTATNRWQYKYNERYNDEQVPFYWYRLMADPAFVDQLKTRWAEHRRAEYSDENISAKIDSIATLLTSKGAQQRNEEAWGIFSRNNIWPCPYYPADYNEEISYLKNWIMHRARFMDSQLAVHDTEDITPDPSAEAWPLPVASGWNSDLIAESTPASDYCDNGIDGSMCFYTSDVSANGGLPSDGNLISPASKVQYHLFYSGASALHMEQAGESASLTLKTPTACSRVWLLAASGNGESTLGVRLDYADGSSADAGQVVIKDWSVREPDGTEAASGLGRITGDGNPGDNPHYAMFEFCFPADNSRKLSGVTLTHLGGGMSNVFAVSSDSKDNSSLPAGIGCREKAVPVAYYNMQGIRIENPTTKGIYITVYSDGTSRKETIR